MQRANLAAILLLLTVCENKDAEMEMSCGETTITLPKLYSLSQTRKIKKAINDLEEKC